jgi:hypothetical protein
VEGGPDRSRDEGGQNRQHPHRSAAGGIERARGAAAAKLHPDAEGEGPDRRGDAHGQDHAARLAHPDQRVGDDADQPDQQKLGPDPGAAPVAQDLPPARGEAEGRMVKRDPGRKPDQRRMALRLARFARDKPQPCRKAQRPDDNRCLDASCHSPRASPPPLVPGLRCGDHLRYLPLR